MMDGYIMYQGKAKDSTAYFASIGHQCPLQSNPADFYMKVLTVNYPKQAEDENKIKFLMDNYNQRLASNAETDHKAIQLAKPSVKEAESEKASFCE